MKLQGSDTGGRRREGGFTLIELLVVVAIIVLLAGLIIAAMPGAKKRAYDSSTMQLLTGLSTNCEQYFQNFDAYPGPMSPALTTAGNPTGTQNMLLGLTYPIYVGTTYYTLNTPNAPTAKNGAPKAGGPSTGWVLAPGGGAEVNPADLSGPIDYSTSPPRSHQTYFTPSAKELSAPLNTGAWDFGGVTGAGATAVKFPTVLDRYLDAMPILYYRRSPSVEASAAVTTDSSGRINSSVASLVGNSSTTVTAGTAPTVPYYLADNVAYTNSSGLKASTGLTFAQGVFNEQDLAGYAANQKLTGGMSVTISARGGFILVSAGYDHIYGKNPKAVTNDDIYLVGGH